MKKTWSCNIKKREVLAYLWFYRNVHCQRLFYWVENSPEQPRCWYWTTSLTLVKILEAATKNIQAWQNTSHRFHYLKMNVHFSELIIWVWVTRGCRDTIQHWIMTTFQVKKLWTKKKVQVATHEKKKITCPNALKNIFLLKTTHEKTNSCFHIRIICWFLSWLLKLNRKGKCEISSSQFSRAQSHFLR